MATYRCPKCGQTRSETPFCHGPMECVQENSYAEAIDNVRDVLGLESTHYLVIHDEVRDVVQELERLRNLMRAFGAADIAYDGIEQPKPGQDLMESYYALRDECRKIAGASDGNTE